MPTSFFSLIYFVYSIVSKGFSFSYGKLVRYRAHVLATELSARTMEHVDNLQDRVTAKFKSSLGDWSSRIRITLATNFLYFL